MTFRDSWFAVLVPMLLAGGGCGGPADPRPARVAFEARVMFEGKPVADAVVVLAPLDPKGAAASGTSQSDGLVRFSTFGSQDGVVPGSYGISVMKTVVEEAPVLDSSDPSYDPLKAERQVPKSRELLPERYKTPAKSGLTVDVVEATTEPHVLDLEQ